MAPTPISPGIDTVWVSQSTYLIFLMQLGFAFLEAGTIRSKNINSILLKNLLDICICGFFWYLIGYGVAFGDSQNGFLGGSRELFALSEFDGASNNYWSHYLFQWAFAGTAATIVSGCVAERMPIRGYVLFSVFMSIFIYPVVCHWVWADSGWLTKKVDGHKIYHDFAGSSVVHMVGGFSGLIATIVIKPRLGRFEQTKQQKKMTIVVRTFDSRIMGHEIHVNPFDDKLKQVHLVVLGTLILWFGWYGFNCGSTIAASDAESSQLIGQIGVTTTISASVGGIVCYMIAEYRKQNIQTQTLKVTMGILAGLVAITASCDTTKPWEAVIIGFIAGFVFEFISALLVKLQIDDPLDASPIHFGCGVWAMIATAFFHKEEGIFYGGSGLMLGYTIAGIVCIMVWAGSLTFIFLQIIRQFNWVRVSEIYEIKGFDSGENQQLEKLILW